MQRYPGMFAPTPVHTSKWKPCHSLIMPAHVCKHTNNSSRGNPRLLSTRTTGHVLSAQLCDIVLSLGLAKPVEKEAGGDGKQSMAQPRVFRFPFWPSPLHWLIPTRRPSPVLGSTMVKHGPNRPSSDSSSAPGVQASRRHLMNSSPLTISYSPNLQQEVIKYVHPFPKLGHVRSRVSRCVSAC